MIKSHHYPPLTGRIPAHKMNSVGLLSNVQILTITTYCNMKREPEDWSHDCDRAENHKVLLSTSKLCWRELYDRFETIVFASEVLLAGCWILIGHLKQLEMTWSRNHKRNIVWENSVHGLLGQCQLLWVHFIYYFGYWSILMDGTVKFDWNKGQIVSQTQTCGTKAHCVRVYICQVGHVSGLLVGRNATISFLRLFHNKCEYIIKLKE